MWENSGHEQKGRDGCRVPIPWTTTGSSFGFGDGAPWLPQPDFFGKLSVETQTGVTGSTLEMYRQALGARAKYLTADEQLEWLELGDEVLAFRRGSGVLCIVNFGKDAMTLPTGTILVSSVGGLESVLPQDAAIWLLPTR